MPRSCARYEKKWVKTFKTEEEALAILKQVRVEAVVDPVAARKRADAEAHAAAQAAATAEREAQRISEAKGERRALLTKLATFREGRAEDKVVIEWELLRNREIVSRASVPELLDTVAASATHLRVSSGTAPEQLRTVVRATPSESTIGHVAVGRLTRSYSRMMLRSAQRLRHTVAEGGLLRQLHLTSAVTAAAGAQNNPLVVVDQQTRSRRASISDDPSDITQSTRGAKAAAAAASAACIWPSSGAIAIGPRDDRYHTEIQSRYNADGRHSSSHASSPPLHEARDVGGNEQAEIAMSFSRLYSPAPMVMPIRGHPSPDSFDMPSNPTGNEIGAPMEVAPFARAPITTNSKVAPAQGHRPRARPARSHEAAVPPPPSQHLRPSRSTLSSFSSPRSPGLPGTPPPSRGATPPSYASRSRVMTDARDVDSLIVYRDPMTCTAIMTTSASLPQIAPLHLPLHPPLAPQGSTPANHEPAPTTLASWRDAAALDQKELHEQLSRMRLASTTSHASSQQAANTSPAPAPALPPSTLLDRRPARGGVRLSASHGQLLQRPPRSANAAAMGATSPSKVLDAMWWCNASATQLSTPPPEPSQRSGAMFRPARLEGRTAPAQRATKPSYSNGRHDSPNSSPTDLSGLNAEFRQAGLAATVGDRADGAFEGGALRSLPEGAARAMSRPAVSSRRGTKAARTNEARGLQALPSSPLAPWLPSERSSPRTAEGGSSFLASPGTSRGRLPPSRSETYSSGARLLFSSQSYGRMARAGGGADVLLQPNPVLPWVPGSSIDLGKRSRRAEPLQAAPAAPASSPRAR